MRLFIKDMAIWFELAIFSYLLYLYYTTPLVFSSNVCFQCLIFVCISFTLVVIKTFRNTFLSFDNVFFLSFLYTNFLFANFLYVDNPAFSLFQFGYNERYITHCTILAAIAYSCYAMARLMYGEKKLLSRRQNGSIYTVNSSKKGRIIAIFSMGLLSVMYLKNIGINYTKIDIGQIGTNLQDICNCFIIYYLIVSACKSTTIKECIKRLGVIFCLILFMTIVTQLLIGSRTFTLRIGLLSLLLYDLFICRIKIKYLLLLFTVGFVFMFALGETRNGSNGEGISKNPIINVGNELIINNRSLFVLVEYADKNGITYGQSYLINLLSVIPFGNSLIKSIFDITEEDMSSGYKNTMLTFKYDSQFAKVDFIGLGTNLIGDIYYASGFLGVIISMFILGVVISKAENNKDWSFLWLIVYCLFFMNAIYYPRSEYFNLARIFTWTYLLFRIINKKEKYKCMPNKRK